MWYLQPVKLTGCPQSGYRFQAKVFHTELVNQIPQPLPGYHVNERIAHEVGVACIDVGLLDFGQWMRKALRRCCRKGENEVQRHPKALSTMHVRKAGRVGNDGVCDKRRLVTH